MIQIKAVSVGPIATNCYIVYDDETNDAFVIDPGYEWDAIVPEIQDLHVRHILLTHAHWDHIGGVERIRELTGAPVCVHEIESSWLTDPVQNLSGRSDFTPSPVICREADVLLSGGESLNLLGETVDVLHTPGHSPGHVIYVMGDVIFGGDVLFMGSVGRTDLPGGDFDALIQSIHDHFLSRPDETTVLPGHGPPTTIERERASNPFFVNHRGLRIFPGNVKRIPGGRPAGPPPGELFNRKKGFSQSEMNLTHMNPGRLLVVIILLVGIIVAGLRLRSLDVPFVDVLLTGATFFLSLALLFLILIGAGKLIGWLFSNDEKDDV